MIKKIVLITLVLILTLTACSKQESGPSGALLDAEAMIFNYDSRMESAVMPESFAPVSKSSRLLIRVNSKQIG